MIDLTGLETRPAQTWGAIRMVPLVRREPITDLRLHRRLYDRDDHEVDLPDRTFYTSYIPHAYVAVWGDNAPEVSYGTQFGDLKDTVRLGTIPRLARRTNPGRLRFLPQHLAMEGYLALHFGGPEIAWEHWSHQALRHGLSPRQEAAYAGADVPGLDDALRVFEIHPGQCGLILYTGDQLASAVVLPHPHDYRALHPTLIHDLFGETIYTNAMFSHGVHDFTARLPPVISFYDLHAAIDRAESSWTRFHAEVMARGLLDGAHSFEQVHRMGRFTLSRFLPSFARGLENHIGEVITDSRGLVAYLKSFRLSDAQTRRGHLLNVMAAHDWSFGAAARALGAHENDLVGRLDRAGFSYLLRPDILRRYRQGYHRHT
ncbi:hypothetical protein OIE66_08015 [Nonomuraea sp. NBC_01738]|uniref:ARPP-2 domain-containing protein n=1 Tax=Nonomuraea sp. NBC_01738 TaxID=2976003 RepID=UPI002E162F3B|nr:hypothetical protein OIE66_08015 [Nonomuraea sp. NBC_01738]